MNTRDSTEENTHGYLYAMVLAPPNVTTPVAVSVQLEWVITFSEPMQEDNGFDIGQSIRPTSDAEIYIAALAVLSDGTKNAVLCWSNHTPVTYEGLSNKDDRNIYLFPAGITTAKEGTKCYYGVLTLSSYLRTLYFSMFPTFTQAKLYQETKNMYNGWNPESDGPWNQSTPCYLVNAWSPMLKMRSALAITNGIQSENFHQPSQSSPLTVGRDSKPLSKTSKTTSQESLVLVSQQPRQPLEELY